MMGSEQLVENLPGEAALFPCKVPGTGLEPVTFGCLRHFEVYRAHLIPLQVSYESDAPPTTPPRQRRLRPDERI